MIEDEPEVNNTCNWHTHYTRTCTDKTIIAHTSYLWKDLTSQGLLRYDHYNTCTHHLHPLTSIHQTQGAKVKPAYAKVRAANTCTMHSYIPLSHTHTHTHTHTLITHIHYYCHTHISTLHTFPFNRTHTHTHMHSLTHTLTHIYHSHSLLLPHTHNYTTHIPIQSHTHTHTHTCMHRSHSHAHITHSLTLY